MKKLLPCVLVFALCLSGCGSKRVALVPALEGLITEEALQKKLSDSICVPENVTSDGHTRILQVVGDEMTLHLAVEVTFQTEGVAAEKEAPLPESPVKFYEGAWTEGETLPEVQGDTIGVTWMDESKYPEENTVIYHIIIASPNKVMQGQKTLVLSNFQRDGETLPEPDHWVSWEVKNTAKIIDMELKTPEGEKVGVVTLTPFVLRVTVFPLSAVGMEGEEVLTNLQLLRKDGTSTSVSGSSGGGLGSESARVNVQFFEALDLDQITAVVLGECRAEVPKK